MRIYHQRSGGIPTAEMSNNMNYLRTLIKQLEVKGGEKEFRRRGLNVQPPQEEPQELSLYSFL